MNREDHQPHQQTKITKDPTPRHPDPTVIISALRASLTKIRSTSC